MNTEDMASGNTVKDTEGKIWNVLYSWWTKDGSYIALSDGKTKSFRKFQDSKDWELVCKSNEKAK